MIENMKNFVFEDNRLLVVIIGVLVVFFIFWYLYCKDNQSPNKIKGGANFVYFPVEPYTGFSSMMCTVGNTDNTGEDFEKFYNTISDFYKNKVLNSEGNGCWDIEFYYGFYEYDKKTHEGFPWVKIGVLSRTYNFGIGSECGSHAEIINLGLLGIWGFYVTSIFLEEAILGPIMKAKNNREKLESYFWVLRGLENFCHEKLRDKLKGVIRIGGTLIKFLSGIKKEKSLSNKNFLIKKELIKETLKSKLKSGQSFSNTQGELFVFDFNSSFPNIEDFSVLNYKNLMEDLLDFVIKKGFQRLNDCVTDNGLKIYDHSNILHITNDCKPVKGSEITFSKISDSDILRPFTFSEEMEKCVSLSMLTNDDKSFEADDALSISRGYKDMLKIEHATRADAQDIFSFSSQPTSPIPQIFQREFIWTNQRVIALLDYYEKYIGEINDFTSNNVNFPDILKGISDEQCRKKLLDMLFIFENMSVKEAEDKIERFVERKDLGKRERRKNRKDYRNFESREEDIEDEEEDREDEEKKIDGNLEKYGLLLISKLGLDKNNSDLRKLILDNCDLKDDITTKICYDKKGESKGCGIIKYKNEEDARKILQKFKSAKVFDPMEFF